MSTPPLEVYSPSVTLEKGAYRIRAPRPRSNTLQHNEPVQRRPVREPRIHGRRLLVLALLLAVASLSSFAYAYYLFTTRWANFAHSRSVQQADSGYLPLVIPLAESASALDLPPDAKYLSYLSHSGFHNQRIALENALVLSRLLNRTLLVPPVRLGTPLRYLRYDKLQNTLSLSDKTGLDHCPLSDPSPPECFNYFDWTNIPWSWLVNITNPVIWRMNMSTEWPLELLGIKDEDIYTLPDTLAYNYQFADTPESSASKYAEIVSISSLASSKARLLQLGTLFGSSRLRLRVEENLALRKAIRRDMAFTNSLLSGAAAVIHDALGGDSYIGAHIRLGDGDFRLRGEVNVRLVWWKLVHEVFQIPLPDALSLERSLKVQGLYTEPEAGSRPPTIEPDLPSLRSPHPPNPFPEHIGPHPRCRGRLYRSGPLIPLNMPLFISTDVSSPLSHPALQPLLRTFPCTFFLDDFVGYMTELDQVTNELDGLHMKDFILPFVDAMIVASAWEVVGTDGSTFSRFVKDVLWRRYHDWDIVSRG